MISHDLLRLTEPNTSFSRKTPGLQLAWDSTSLGLLKSCPWKYYLSLIEGWQPKSMADPLAFGIWFHEAMEKFYYLIAEDTDYDEAIIEVVNQTLLKTGSRNDAGVFEPWKPDDNRRTRANLVRAIVWYLDAHRKDNLTTLIRPNGKPAVELSFKFDLDKKSSGAGENFILAGHLDRVVEFDGRNYVTDYKTSGSTLSSYFFDKFTPSNQMSLYTWAGNVIFDKPLAGVIIDGVQVAVGFNRFGRGFAPRTPEQIEEWMEDTFMWIDMAERYALNQHWPMNDTACSMYGGCDFRGICEKSPKVRESFLEANFTRRVWDPLISRGE
jgi:hypothetical protein